MAQLTSLAAAPWCYCAPTVTAKAGTHPPLLHWRAPLPFRLRARLLDDELRWSDGVTHDALSWCRRDGPEATVTVSVGVTNNGEFSGGTSDEVVMVFAKPTLRDGSTR